MKKETLRMQMLAGVITESQYKQKLNEIIDRNLLEKYHDILSDIGGQDLAGDLEDMLEFSIGFDSFEDFIKNEFEVLEDPETIEQIKDALETNGIKY